MRREPRTLVLGEDWLIDRVVSWKGAVHRVLNGRADVIAEYENDPIMTASGPYPRPCIIVTKSRPTSKKKKGVRRGVSFTAELLHARDEGHCQYCGVRLRRSEATVDHIIPRSKGGNNTWENVVLACSPCNHMKADRTPEQAGMPILRPQLVKAPDFRFISKEALSAHLGHRVPDQWEPWLKSSGTGLWDADYEDEDEGVDMDPTVASEAEEFWDDE